MWYPHHRKSKPHIKKATTTTVKIIKQTYDNNENNNNKRKEKHTWRGISTTCAARSASCAACSPSNEGCWPASGTSCPGLLSSPPRAQTERTAGSTSAEAPSRCSPWWLGAASSASRASRQGLRQRQIDARTHDRWRPTSDCTDMSLHLVACRQQWQRLQRRTCSSACSGAPPPASCSAAGRGVVAGAPGGSAPWSCQPAPHYDAALCVPSTQSIDPSWSQKKEEKKKQRDSGIVKAWECGLRWKKRERNTWGESHRKKKDVFFFLPATCPPPFQAEAEQDVAFFFLFSVCTSPPIGSETRSSHV